MFSFVACPEAPTQSHKASKALHWPCGHVAGPIVCPALGSGWVLIEGAQTTSRFLGYNSGMDSSGDVRSCEFQMYRVSFS